MPGARVDAVAAVGAELPAAETAWTPASVALYHLGIGAGAGEPGSDLDLLLEDRLRPLPSFATLSCLPAMIHLDQAPGLAAIDLARVLHGEHRVDLACLIPAAGRVRTVGAIEAVEEKDGNAFVTVRQESRWPDGSPAWVNRYKMVARGVGAFAGTPPAPEPVAPETNPSADPDHVIAIPTSPQQAALYRHSGDEIPSISIPGTPAQAGSTPRFCRASPASGSRCGWRSGICSTAWPRRSPAWPCALRAR